MAQIISAASKFSASRQGVKRGHFLSQAHLLLSQAQHAVAVGKDVEAFEFAYQAALRTAGAWVAESAVSKRRKLPSSAWERLELVGPVAREWAGEFKGLSRRRSRLMNGLDSEVSSEEVKALIERAIAFLYAVEVGSSVEDAA